MAKYQIYDFLAVDVPISQGYGENVPYYAQVSGNTLQHGHEGIDFQTVNGTPLYAPFAGVIVRDTFDGKAYGNFIVVWDPIQCIALWFCHLLDTTVAVSDHVVAGQLIGHTNNTGNTTGPHCHVNFVETDTNGMRLHTDNGEQGFLNLMDASLVDYPFKPFPGIQTPTVPPVPAPDVNANLSQGLAVYKGLDMTNVESVKAAIDAWYDVTHGVYVRKIEYDTLQTEKNQAITDAQTIKDTYTTDLKNYTEMQAAGYSSLSDINKKIEVMESDTTTLTQSLIAAKDRNKVLSGQIDSFEGVDIAGLKQWLRSKDNVSNLEHIVITFAGILKTKPNLTSMLTAFDAKFREYDQRIRTLKEQQVADKIVTDVVKQHVRDIEQNPDMWTKLFGMFSAAHITEN